MQNKRKYAVQGTEVLSQRKSFLKYIGPLPDPLLLLAICICYTFAYAVLFEVAGYLHGLSAFSLCYPPAGLRFFLIVILGPRFAIAAAVCEVTAQYLIGSGTDLLPHWSSYIIGISAPPIIYGLFIKFLKDKGYITFPLVSLKALLWLGFCGISAPFLAGSISMAVPVLSGSVPISHALKAYITFGIGDAIGILMFAPLLLLIFNPVRIRASGKHAFFENQLALEKRLFRKKEFWLEVAFAILVGASISYLTLLWSPIISAYPMSIPLIWISFRYGITASTAMIFILCMSASVLLVLYPTSLEIRTDIQFLVILEALIALAIGAYATSNFSKEQERREQLTQFAAMDRLTSIGELGASLAHEIATPVSAANMYITECKRLASTGVEVDTLEPPLGKALDQLNRIMHETERIRSFVKRGKGSHELFSSELLCHEIKELLTLEANRHGTSLKIHYPENFVQIHGDKNQLQQCIFNLVRNAAQATSHHKGHVDVFMETNCDMLRVNVIDNGKLDKIAPFDTAKAILVTEKQEGMGLGLAIVRSILETHNGHLEIKRRNGTHTVASLFIPIEIS
ncbi:ATP-binding protein [Hirschia litorea]|uniref:ATP-binding protein n=1 Tax=Hirschia litorea TaxID=1199156 RepID=A0ABW2IPU0_9PROT